MTERVDFYVLKSTGARERWHFACRLTERAYLRDLTVALLCDTAADAEAIDDLLWTFSDRSFVPHELCRGAPAGMAPVCTAPAPVRLTADLGLVDGADVLVNLSGRVPEHRDRFARIAEIVDADGERRAQGRERFKAYRDLKLPVETHHDV